jgi:hypothetical protein
MSILVNTIDSRKAKELLKSCPKEVRDYVKALKKAMEKLNGEQLKTLNI